MTTSTKLYFIPLGEFAAPALLVAHAFEHDGGSAAECHLMEPTAGREPIVDFVYAQKAHAQEQLLDAVLVKAENYIRLLRSRVPKDQLSSKDVEEAPFGQLSARLLVGQFPHWSGLPARSRDPQGLATFLDPITPKLALEPLASEPGAALPAGEEQPKRRWPPMLRLRLPPRSNG